MSLSRSGSKYSRHDRLSNSNSQILDTRKASTPKLFQITKSVKNGEQPNFFLSVNKAPDYGQQKLVTNDLLKSKIKEKRMQQQVEVSELLNKIVTKVDSTISRVPKKKLMIDSTKLSIDATSQIVTKFKPYSLTPQSRQTSFRLQSPTMKPRSQSQIKRVESYYLHKVQAAFDSNSCDYFSRLHREHFHQTYQGLNHKFVPQNANDYNRSIRLPKKPEHKNKITLFFDLDETLVHCNESPQIPSDVLLEITVSKFQTVKAGINIRPYARELLKNLSPHFELIVFTASHSCYAEKVIHNLDPEGTLISHKLFREHCTMTNNQLYTKDLRIFCDNTNRLLSQVALIDNAAYSYAWQVDNGIPIVPFYDSRDDRELIDLEKYLKGMIGCEDVREYNRQHLKLHQFADSKGPYKVLENIFGKQQQQHYI